MPIPNGHHGIQGSQAQGSQAKAQANPLGRPQLHTPVQDHQDRYVQLSLALSVCYVSDGGSGSSGDPPLTLEDNQRVFLMMQIG